LSREAAAAVAIAVAASRLDALSILSLRADARSYVLPSLRDSQLCNFTRKKCGGRAGCPVFDRRHLLATSSQPG